MMVQTQELSFSYSNNVAFQFPNLHCEAGGTLLITGPSGRGKTTLLHLLAGLLTPQSGAIWVHDTDLSGLRGRTLDRFRGQHIGVVFQKAHVVAALPVLDNLVLAGWLATGQKQPKKAFELLERLGLTSWAQQLPARLSVGQLQRVAIARALMNDPKLLLADEPTANLDDDNAALVAELLREQAQWSGAALLIVTHDARLKSIFPQQLPLI
jgi:ABC-type lipoprotein export system ATPase subunit